MTDVTLEYCVPCGFRDRALETGEAVLTSLEDEIDRFEFAMGAHGVFRVDVDGETVYDKSEDGYDVDEIVRAVQQAI